MLLLLLSIISLVELILKFKTTNKVFLAVKRRNSIQLPILFEVEVIAYNFDHKRLEIRLVNNKYRDMVVALGLHLDEHGCVLIDDKQDFKINNMEYNLISDIF